MYNPAEKTTKAASVSSRPSARILRGVPLIALILFIAVMDARSLGAQAGHDSAPYGHDDRVLALIVQLADRAHLSDDIEFAVRAQAQAGLLVWPYDRDQARAIFRRAFQRLHPSASKPFSAFERARRQQLRSDLLYQIAYCDPEMADSLAREFALSKKSLVASRGPVEAESRDLLVGVALRVAEVDRDRAVLLGELSLEAGISPYLDRLLMLIGETDPALACRLFSHAVNYLERAERVSPGDLHTLCFYLVSSNGASDRDRLARKSIVRFLNLASDVVMGNCPVSQATASRNATDRAFEIECTGKYLLELLPRYLPDRAAQVRNRLSELDKRGTSSPSTGINAAQSFYPGSIEQAARNSADEGERDLLYARATFGWLARGDVFEAQQTALNIENAEVRDRALLAVARRLISKASIKDAMLIARLIQDRVDKTGLIVGLAQASLSLRNRACAKTLLDLAELEASKIERPLDRSRSLLAIVAGYSTFDPARAFAVMQAAVRSINEIPALEQQALDPKQSASRVEDAKGEELFQLRFAAPLTALSRIDFDRALLLAQQLTDKETSLIAQLAVCRGGLRPDGSEQR
jgi:hypothetical protein